MPVPDKEHHSDNVAQSKDEESSINTFSEESSEVFVLEESEVNSQHIESPDVDIQNKGKDFLNKVSLSLSGLVSSIRGKEETNKSEDLSVEEHVLIPFFTERFSLLHSHLLDLGLG